MNPSAVLIIQQLQTEGNIMSFYATGKLLVSMKQKTIQRINSIMYMQGKRAKKRCGGFGILKTSTK
jgi:hypothetical protein